MAQNEVIDSKKHVQQLADDIFCLQSAAYTAIYKTKTLELTFSGMQGNLLPAFKVIGLVLYY